MAVSDSVATCPRVNPWIFRTSDIRGNAETDLSSPVVAAIADAIAANYLEQGARRVSLARDCRLSSPRLHGIVGTRLVQAGLEVWDLGMVPSPALYFSVFHQACDGGVMVTASHNPAQDNGLKIVRGRKVIHGEEMEAIRVRVGRATVNGAIPGTVSARDVLPSYGRYLRGCLRLGSRRPTVVLDGGNGAAGPPCYRLLRDLGFAVEPLFCEPDGRFPNHPPDPSVPENLAALAASVRRTGAEVGIALDGDGDRLGVVDATGRVIPADRLLLLFGREILRERPGATFIGEVKCSQAVYDDLARRGGRVVMSRVGHAIIRERMLEEGALAAAELSGHVFFRDRYFGYDDAVYAAARLLELLSHSQATLAELVDELPIRYASPEIRVPCSDELKSEVVARVVNCYRGRRPLVELDGARIEFSGGWGLVRASGTGPFVVMRCEADSVERLATIQRELEQSLQVARGLVVGAASDGISRGQS